MPTEYTDSASWDDELLRPDSECEILSEVERVLCDPSYGVDEEPGKPRFAIRFYSVDDKGSQVGKEVIRSFDESEFVTFLLSGRAPRQLQWIGQILAICADGAHLEQ
jgi:hypothetical protein